MKPIIQEETQDTILTKDITEQHIVVMSNKELVSILSADSFGGDIYSFKILSNSFITGNVSTIGEGSTSIKKAVDEAIKYDNKVAVFHQSDWKQALQWLIDNA